MHKDRYEGTRRPRSDRFSPDLLCTEIWRAHYGAHGRYFRALQFSCLVDKEVRNTIERTHERTCALVLCTEVMNISEKQFKSLLGTSHVHLHAPRGPLGESLHQ